MTQNNNNNLYISLAAFLLSWILIKDVYFLGFSNPSTFDFHGRTNLQLELYEEESLHVKYSSNCRLLCIDLSLSFLSRPIMLLPILDSKKVIWWVLNISHFSPDIPDLSAKKEPHVNPVNGKRERFPRRKRVRERRQRNEDAVVLY